MEQQTECFWPSGTVIRRMNRERCLEVLGSFGVEGAAVEKLSRRALRGTIERLKRQSHTDGSCECPAAQHIRQTINARMPRQGM